jgi:hypothetical protein
VKGVVTILVGPREKPIRVRVSATVLGTWAYHRYKYDGFTVTHVPTGLSLNDLCADLALSDARRIARRLQREFSKRGWHSKNIRRVLPDDDRWAFQAVVAEEFARCP